MKITLKAARINANLTQVESAKMLDVNKQTISNWEKGNSFPDAKQIEKIEKLYRVSYDDINFLQNNYT